MQVTREQQYTFHFSLSGNDVLGNMGQPDAILANAIVAAGFPISISSHGLSQDSSGFFGGLTGQGTVDISFSYSGSDTDSDSLGNAMQDAVNNAGAFGALSSIVVNFESADGGNTSTGTINQIAQNSPSLSTFGIGALAIIALLVVLFAFGEGLGKGIA
jgi:hypothetical protein